MAHTLTNLFPSGTLDVANSSKLISRNQTGKLPGSPHNMLQEGLQTGLQTRLNLDNIIQLSSLPSEQTMTSIDQHELSTTPSSLLQGSSPQHEFSTISSSLLQGLTYGQTEQKQDTEKIQAKKNRDNSTGCVYKCEVCGLVFESQGNLNRHSSLKCNKNEPFECPVCKYEFQHRYDAKFHYNKTHQDHIEKFGNWFQQESERKMPEKERRLAALKPSYKRKQTKLGGEHQRMSASQKLNMSTSSTTWLEASDSTPHPFMATAELSLTSGPIEPPSLYSPHHADVKPFLGRVAPGNPSSGGGDPR